MKKLFLSLVCGLLINITFINKSMAVTCLIPSPVCGVLLGLEAVVGFVAVSQKPQLAKIKVAERELDLKLINKQIHSLENGDYVLRMSHQWANYNPGYSTIMNYYKEGMLTGRLSLQSLKEFNPQIFNDLDTLENVFVQQAGEQAVKTAYGLRNFDNGSVNWAHYVALAQDAQILYSNAFFFRN